MPHLKKTNAVVYEFQPRDHSPDILEIRLFLNANKQRLGLKNIHQVPQKEVKANFLGQDEIVEFDLIIKDDGTTIKANYRVTPDPSGENGAKRGGIYSVDLSKIKDPVKIRLALEKFSQVIVQSKLKLHPANQELRLYGGKGLHGKLSEQILIHEFQKNMHLFQDKGIQVFINDKLVIGRKQELQAVSEPKKQRRSKPWDVPHGAPDARKPPTPEK